VTELTQAYVTSLFWCSVAMLSDAQVCAFWAHMVPCSCPSKTVQQLLANKQVLFKKSVCGNRHRNWKMTLMLKYRHPGNSVCNALRTVVSCCCCVFYLSKVNNDE